MKKNARGEMKHSCLSQLELVVYDFDGVMTDNKVLVFQDGKEAVVCNRGDGLGIKMIQEIGIPQIIISTESNPVVKARAKKIGVEVFCDVSDKRETLTSFCTKRSYDLSKVIFVGNDINDLGVMKMVGLPICPYDADEKIKKKSKIVLKTCGGNGVVRELADLIVKASDRSIN